MMQWRPGERERWLRLGSGPVVSFERTPARFLAEAPDQVAGPLLADWIPSRYMDGCDDLKVIVARFGMAAHAAIMRAIGISGGAAPIEAARAGTAAAAPWTAKSTILPR